MTIAVCWKWVAVDGDERWAGVSDADRAALELALHLAGPDPVAVLTAGPAGAETSLREALAVGAAHAVRIDMSPSSDSRTVAEALARAVADVGEQFGLPRWVLCGDYSADRGSGSVPAFLAAELGWAQALGLVGVDVVSGEREGDGESDEQRLVATRRLDGGRRELLRVDAPAVLSVEGSIAQLRRATLSAELSARHAAITVSPGPVTPAVLHGERSPYRPRARALAAPHGDTLARIRVLTDADSSAPHGETVELDPPAAAARIVDALREWGYLPPTR